MGCHTWFSTKLETQPEYEEIREKFLDFLMNEMGYFERHISNTLSEKEAWLFEDKTVEQSIQYLEILKRVYRLVLNRYCKIATMRHFAETVMQMDFCERNHLYYRDIRGAHDIFRIGGYPNDELLSLEETLEFFEKNDDKIFWGYGPNEFGKENVIQMIKDFWIKYPEGRIRFG